ncbi:hypothetical protein AJ80_05703 [Polytolypa hystricis UAMH7299]|uniref:Phosphoglycerate mutase n=1 Tax=Polytolypa hystricis (strain UAMH7299) TaxID=1447883 RepID=A0A2B7Y0Y1_POLH7|nr:hypothetical protein AJ80_05703 [Polytolypa hystricis UAMH7299]
MASSPFLLFLTIIVAFFTAMSESTSLSHLEFSAVTGYFLQDDPATDPDTFDYSSTNFGLINQTYDTDDKFDPHHKKTQWERFGYKLRSLNRAAGTNTRFALLYLGRHGEGYHNVAESYYGTEAWDCYWSLLDGNETSTWADARLTDAGKAQAELARDTWIAQIKNKVPLPEIYYTSPLDRCLSTAQITFDDLDLPTGKDFKPIVKELLRETLGIHTCDRRSSASYIRSAYPDYVIPHSFAEEDPLWDAKLRESNSARSARLRKFLVDIFTPNNNKDPSPHHDQDEEDEDTHSANSRVNKDTYISLTAHSGAITSILEIVGHRKFAVSTGGVIPVLVRVERKPGAPPKEEIEPPSTAPECRGDPTTVRGELMN